MQTPRVDKIDMERDVIFCGKQWDAPGHGNLLARLSTMMNDKGLPSYKEGAEAENVVADGFYITLHHITSHYITLHHILYHITLHQLHCSTSLHHITTQRKLLVILSWSVLSWCV